MDDRCSPTVSWSSPLLLATSPSTLWATSDMRPHTLGHLLRPSYLRLSPSSINQPSRSVKSARRLKHKLNNDSRAASSWEPPVQGPSVGASLVNLEDMHLEEELIQAARSCKKGASARTKGILPRPSPKCSVGCVEESSRGCWPM